MSVHHMHAWYRRRQEEGIGSSGIGVTDGCEPHYERRELNPGPRQEHHVLITAEPSLQISLYCLFLGTRSGALQSGKYTTHVIDIIAGRVPTFILPGWELTADQSRLSSKFTWWTNAFSGVTNRSMGRGLRTWARVTQKQLRCWKSTPAWVTAHDSWSPGTHCRTCRQACSAEPLLSSLAGLHGLRREACFIWSISGTSWGFLSYFLSDFFFVVIVVFVCLFGFCLFVFWEPVSLCILGILKLTL